MVPHGVLISISSALWWTQLQADVRGADLGSHPQQMTCQDVQ